MNKYSGVKVNPTFMKSGKVINQPIYFKIQTVDFSSTHVLYNMEAKIRDQDGSHLLTE